MTEHRKSRNAPETVTLDGYTVDAIENFWLAREHTYRVKLGVEAESYPGEAADLEESAAASVAMRMDLNTPAIKAAYDRYIMALNAVIASPQHQAWLARRSTELE